MATSMLKSAAYERMRAENLPEFVPRGVFFARGEGSEVDRRSSLWVKAALVYESITGRHVDDGAKPVATALLLRLAQACSSSIHGNGPAVPAASSPNGVAGKDGTTGGEKSENQQEISTSQGDQEEATKTTDHQLQLPADEGSEENKRVIDAIFLVVGFLPRLLPVSGAGNKVSRDAVDEAFKSTHMQDIVTDVIKLENQLPLSDLLLVADRVEDAVHAVAANDLGVVKELQGLEEERLKGYKLGFSRATFFHDVVRSFCWYYSPFFSKLPAAPQDGGAIADDSLTLLDLLHASVVPAPGKKEKGTGVSGGKTSRMPTARELSRSGVRIAAVGDGRATVEFDEQSSTLRLPALAHDFKLATVGRNLLAKEHGQPGDGQSKKPVTRYFQMMNELVEEAGDVRVLLRAGAVRCGGGGTAQEVCELVKRIDGYATYPSVFMAMDVQIEKVRRFHDKRMQSFFVRYRPGVIWASSVAAVSVVAIVAARRNRG